MAPSISNAWNSMSSEVIHHEQEDGDSRRNLVSQPQNLIHASPIPQSFATVQVLSRGKCGQAIECKAFRDKEESTGTSV